MNPLPGIICAACSHLESRIGGRQPRVAIVLGSGLGGFADELTDRIEIPYTDIPQWPASTAIGHAGRLVFGKLPATSAPDTSDIRNPTAEIPLVALSGR